MTVPGLASVLTTRAIASCRVGSKGWPRAEYRVTPARSSTLRSSRWISSTPPPTQALRRQIEILTDAGESVRDVPSRLVDDGDDLGVRQPPRPDDAEDADDLVAVGIGRGDQRALAHLRYRVFLADRHVHPLAVGEHRHQVGEALLLLEGPEQLARRVEVPELRVVEHVDRAADIERAAPKQYHDLLDDAARPRVEGVEGIAGRRLHVDDVLDGATAVPAAQRAPHGAYLLGGERRVERHRAGGDPARVGDEDGQRAIVLERDEVDPRERRLLERRREQEARQLRGARQMRRRPLHESVDPGTARRQALTGHRAFWARRRRKGLHVEAVGLIRRYPARARVRLDQVAHLLEIGHHVA